MNDDEAPKVRLGRFLRDRRLALKLTQEVIAERMGVRQSAISAWESGRAFPEFPTILKLSRVLGFDLHRLSELGLSDTGDDPVLEEALG